MRYLVFESKELAEIAEAQIVENIRSFLESIDSKALNTEGLLLGRDSVTKEVTQGGITKKWSDIFECEEGWAIILIDEKLVQPIPYTTILENVGGVTRENITLIPTVWSKFE